MKSHVLFGMSREQLDHLRAAWDSDTGTVGTATACQTLDELISALGTLCDKYGGGFGIASQAQLAELQVRAENSVALTRAIVIVAAEIVRLQNLAAAWAEGRCGGSETAPCSITGVPHKPGKHG